MMKFLIAILFFVFSYWNEVSSITQFNTHEGCNASFVCYHSFGASVNWTSSRGPLKQGPKLVIENASYHSVLYLISVTPAENGNISCQRNQLEALHFSLSVQGKCKDLFNTVTCKGTIDGGDDCTSSWMVTNCRKSCGLCPKFNCTESERPTVPATVPSTTISGYPTSASINNTQSNFNGTSTPRSNASTAKTKYNSTSTSRSNIYIVVFLGIFLATIILFKPL